ncbi:hypothetical protein G7054_g2737 [Neopestalotiopsis clavispora]|nr:hypothetical protein G7054_g2737 [Neopestalotiopsis clavispora]
MALNTANPHDYDAVELTRNYDHFLDPDPDNEGIAPLPRSIRDNIPQEFISVVGGRRVTKLLNGEQGWQTQHSRNGWSLCLFERGPSFLIEFMIPTKYLRVGKKNNLRTINHGLQVTSVPNVQGPNPLVKFIRTFWSLARDQRRALTGYGLWTSRTMSLFDNGSFARNVTALVNALTPEARQVLSNPNAFTLANDINAGMVRVTSGTQSPKMCYLRMYTNADPTNPNLRIEPAFYVGTTETPGKRHMAHNTATTTSSGLHHYRIASKYPAEGRAMFVLMDLGGFDADLTAMAEETCIAIFCSYVGWHFEEREDSNSSWTRESQRVNTMAQLAQAACNSSGFPQIGRSIRAKGCNVMSPLFHGQDGGRQWLRRTIPATPYQPRIHRYSTAFQFPVITQHKTEATRRTAQFWLAPKLPFKLSRQIVEGGQFKTGMLCNLVIEVTADRSPHPKPFVRLPEVGIYENFGEGNCMAMYIISYNAKTKIWYSTQIFNQRSTNSIRKGVYKPEPYIQVKNILQLLEGTRYSETNDHFKERSFTVGSMEYLIYDHLNQTIEYLDVPRPQALPSPLPRLMSYNDNAAIMMQKYPQLSIGPSQRPSMEDRNTRRPGEPANAGWTISFLQRCDFCGWLSAFRSSMSNPCVGGRRQCEPCRLYLQRPCTFTDRATVLTWWDEGDPLYLFFGKDKKTSCDHREIIEPFGGRVMIEELAGQAQDLDDTETEGGESDEEGS